MKYAYKLIKGLLVALFLLLQIQNTNAQTLATGDISIVGINANAPDGIAFVNWVSLPAGTIIKFTDNGFNSNISSNAAGNYREQEQYVVWTNNTGAAIPAGTIITVQINAGSTTTVTNIGAITSVTNSSNGTTAVGMSLTNTSGDQIFAFQGTGGTNSNSATATFSGTLLCGLGYSGSTGTSTGWLTNGAINASTSYLPADLSGNSQIFLGPNVVAAQYNGPKLGQVSLAAFKSLVANPSNWNTTNTGTLSFTTTSFTVDAPVATNVTNTGTLQVGQTLTGNYTYADANNDAESGSTFKWYRSDNAAGLNKAAIVSATAATYVLVAADVSKYISFEVTPKDATGTTGVKVESALRGAVIAGVLPVNLLNFSSKIERNTIKLTWQTASEHNNKKFMIYRRGDDQQFSKIGEVAGAGNTDGQQNYNYQDRLPINGINYYKLVQIDFDGKETELGVKSLNFSLSTVNAMLYPNPTTDRATITFAAGKYTALQVCDFSGKVLQVIALKATTNNENVNLEVYPPGIYLVRLAGKETSETIKVVKK